MIYTRFGSVVKKFAEATGEGWLIAEVDYEDGEPTDTREVNITELKADEGINEIYEAVKNQLGLTSEEIFEERSLKQIAMPAPKIGETIAVNLKKNEFIRETYTSYPDGRCIEGPATVEFYRSPNQVVITVK